MSSDPFGLIGQILDAQFRVDQLVGEGGFSAVYRGRHVGLDEAIALKFLKLQTALGSDVVESLMRRFRDESRLLYRLSQGNLDIVRCMASGTTIAPATGAIVPYMVLEWLDGRSLAAELIVRRTGHANGRQVFEAVALLDSAIDAIAYAHSQGVVHRDLNPGNFFLAQTRTGPRMKVLDFGVAKVVRDEVLALGPRAQTLQAIRIFSPAYAAPEQMDERLGPISPRADVWAIAVILCEVIMDRAVFEGEALGDFFQKVLDPAFPKTPRARGVAVGDATEEVFARALSIQPSDRYQDAGTFWAELRAAISKDTGGATLMGSANPFQANNDKTMMISQVGTMPPPDMAMPPQAPPKAAPTPQPAPRPAAGVPYDATLSAETAEEARKAFTDMKGTLMMSSPLQQPPPAQQQPPAPFGSAAYAGAPPSPAQHGGFGSTMAMQSPVYAQQQQQQQNFGASPPQQQQQNFGNPAQQQQQQNFGASPQQQQQQFGQPSPAYAQQEPPPAYLQSTVQGDSPVAKKPNIALVAIAAFLVVLVLGGVVIALLVHSKNAAAAAAASASISASAFASSVPVSTTTAPALADTAVPTVTATATTPPVDTTAPTADTTPIPTATATVTPTAIATSTATSTHSNGNVATPKNNGVKSTGFNTKDARTALDIPASIIAACRDRSGKTGPGVAHVIFANDGTVTTVTITRPPYGGTPEADCIASKLKRAKMDSFTGPSGSIDYNFSISP